MIKTKECSIKGVFEITPEILEDQRGFFYRAFCKEEFKKITSSEFVQVNHSFNRSKNTLRGLHYQNPPHCEEKIIRCVSGSIFDVFVDLRYNSDTFLHWGSIHLTAQLRNMIFIPKGIAHGFLTLEDNTELIYHHSEFYSPDHESGLKYSDPRIAIHWPEEISIISERDNNHPLIENIYKGLVL